jgi:hypothetical protein
MNLSRAVFPRLGRAARVPGLALALAASLAACADDNPMGGPDVQCDPGGTVKVDGQDVPVAPNGFFTAGNKIYSLADCSPFRFVGVARPALSYSSSGDRLGIDSAAAADFARIRGWRANTVRIELAQFFWLPQSRYYDAGYQARVDRVVKQARQAGLYVILALNASDRGDPAYPGDVFRTNTHQPMPDVNHSIPFWRQVAERYKNDGGVLYELYGEPYPIGGAQEFGFSNWDMWLNGGLAPADQTYEPRAAFQAVGMQRLYDEVRGTGAKNLVLLGGTSWGYFLDGVPDHRVKGFNLVYVAHPWDWPGKQPETWEEDWAFLAKTDPVMISEFGNYDCSPRYLNAALDKADELNLSWIAWAWTAPAPGESTAQDSKRDPICAFPMLITDWAGTPSRIGQQVKDRLARY